MHHINRPLGRCCTKSCSSSTANPCVCECVEGAAPSIVKRAPVDGQLSHSQASTVQFLIRSKSTLHYAMQLMHAAPRPRVAATGNASRTARLTSTRLIAAPTTLHKLAHNRASLQKRSAAEVGLFCIGSWMHAIWTAHPPRRLLSKHKLHQQHRTKHPTTRTKRMLASCT